VIAATHDAKMLKRSDRVLRIEDGRVQKIESGRARRLAVPQPLDRGQSTQGVSDAWLSEHPRQGETLHHQGYAEQSPRPPVCRTGVMVSAREVTRRFMLAGEEVWALRGISLEVHAGEYLSIMGPSGSGKSTFFNLLGALDAPTSGTVVFMGESLFDLPEAKQAWIRCNRIGYIFQTYNLSPVLTALENVALPVIFRGVSRPAAQQRAAELLATVGLADRAHHLPAQLSGGQQQRVAIARALANDPVMILADEPTGNLDARTGAAIIDLLLSLKHEQGVTIVTATHDANMLAASDRIAWIRDGRLERVEG
jgi:putative ABC transport system ATP-binding protein